MWPVRFKASYQDETHCLLVDPDLFGQGFARKGGEDLKTTEIAHGPADLTSWDVVRP